MPRPARNIATRSGGLASRVPAVWANGVWTSTVVVRRITGGFVDQHQRQVGQRRAEGGAVGALIAQHGEPDRGQRVVNDMHIHRVDPTGRLGA